MPVFIEDISKHLGLSISTVSKALNGYDDVAPRTRERVLEAARAMGYSPSAAARSLRRGRSEKIGLFMNNPVSFISEYLMEMLPSIALPIEAQAMNLVLYLSPTATLEAAARIARSGEIDGVLLMWSHSIESLLDVFEQEGLPAVLLGRRSSRPTTNFVAPDNTAGARAATEHLIALGHRRIGFMTRPQLGHTGEDRLAGFLQAHAAAGLEHDPSLLVPTRIEPNSGRAAMHTFLHMEHPPTAVFASHDLTAIDALQVAGEYGVRVPDDMSVVGFDGLPSSRITAPPLTTVRQPFADMALAGVDMLLHQIETRTFTPVQRVFPVELIARDSTGPVTTGPVTAGLVPYSAPRGESASP